MTTNLAGASPVDQPVVRPDPEREEFERWAEENNFCTYHDETDKYREYHRATTRWAWHAWQAARAAETKRWEEALRQTWQMVDPLKPAGTPGSYARGQDSGIAAALTTLRANLKTHNADVTGLAPEKEQL